MGKTIRWGIIGCGNVTELKSGPAYQKTDGFELVAVMRRDAALAEDYAKRHGVARFYTDADLLIADPEVDAVYIATPPDTHAFYALKVAAAGKICCIEKPMARNYIECVTICEAFEAKGLLLFIAYYRRTLEKFLKVKELLAEIGEMRSVRWQLSRVQNQADLSGKYNWRTDAKVAPGGYFDDLASHGFDLFVFLFGQVKAVQGIGINQQGLYSAKDALSASWLHDSKVVGSANWNFGSSLREDIVELYGSHAKITFSMFENHLPIVMEKEGAAQSYHIAPPENIQLFHVAAMRDHLFGIRDYPSSGRMAAHVNWIMDQISGSVSERK
ncbi:Gfo/Idh/MocA family protein [Flavobacterium pallidum]|uniref:Oxidoreductase n=1 Tax=Flavobacterium pallidum TaxID=2172098 RepID=A0A2S1SK24_9FLAO|nr:Gfo/Idh/MocA family oxidoreductase [Flavobacterium pallidum]AWI26712.1 oxidoreductase [Flavobacterium pallidum]